MNKIVRKICMAALLTASLAFAGCGAPVIQTSTGNIFSVGDVRCPSEEARMMLMSIQKDYKQIFGIDLWNHDFGESMDAAEYVRTKTLERLEKIYLLDAAAEDMEIELTEDEIALAQTAAKVYIDGLTDAEKSYIDAGEEDAQSLYERCMLAEKVYNLATEDVDSEISDDEARVMRLLYIYTTSSGTADEAMRSLQEGTEFKAVAASYTEADSTSMTIDRYTFDEDITDQIFILSDGDYSDIIYDGEGYYIFYCEENFDEELTRANYENALTEKKDALADKVVEEYGGQTECKLYEISWGLVAADTSLDVTSPSFSEVYEGVISIAL